MFTNLEKDAAPWLFGPSSRMGIRALAVSSVLIWCTAGAAAPPPSKAVQPVVQSGSAPTAGAEAPPKAGGCCAGHTQPTAEAAPTKSGGCCAEKAKTGADATTVKSGGCGGCGGKGHATAGAAQTTDGGCGGHAQPTAVAAPPAKAGGCAGDPISPAEAAAITKVQQNPSGAAGESAGSPKLVATKTTVTAEPVWRGQPFKFDFEIRNTGTADLMLWPKGG